MGPTTDLGSDPALTLADTVKMLLDQCLLIGEWTFKSLELQLLVTYHRVPKIEAPKGPGQGD